jgi:hypothetical protein
MQFRPVSLPLPVPHNPSQLNFRAGGLFLMFGKLLELFHERPTAVI